MAWNDHEVAQLQTPAWILALKYLVAGVWDRANLL